MSTLWGRTDMELCRIMQFFSLLKSFLKSSQPKTDHSPIKYCNLKCGPDYHRFHSRTLHLRRKGEDRKSQSHLLQSQMITKCMVPRTQFILSSNPNVDYFEKFTVAFPPRDRHVIFIGASLASLTYNLAKFVSTFWSGLNSSRLTGLSEMSSC